MTWMTATNDALTIRGMDRAGLERYVCALLERQFPDGRRFDPAQLAPAIGASLARLGRCFAGIARPKFAGPGGAVFNPLHPDHFSMFLALLANDVLKHMADRDTAFRLYYLNKALHALDVFPDTEMPEVFQFMHPTGTILGPARYGSHFCVYQNCTVGSSENGVYPEFGDGVVLYAGARVIGACRIGSNVVVAANTFVIDRDVPDDTVVISEGIRPRFSPNRRTVIERRFR